MEAYKAIKECHNDQMQYTTMTYLFCENEVFLGLNLIFLDVELEELDNESTSGPRVVVSPLGHMGPPPPTT